ncbi:hypothetical protein GQ55_3G173600 [Panicum hallii var. hallii]|uniref:Uncharacterized protein n=1 Tax=Panicum hallii var. hallii TaxID=1504633 RepID=A0A2T7EAH0_9POAL|nr:hypothetical protein GQ55_3G173600 [Panicum hallii var. hallii]
MRPALALHHPGARRLPPPLLRGRMAPRRRRRAPPLLFIRHAPSCRARQQRNPRRTRRYHYHHHRPNAAHDSCLLPRGLLRARRFLLSWPAGAAACTRPSQTQMTTTRHLDLLLVALLYGCAFTGALLAAASLALLAFLAGALLAASDARRLAGSAARVAGAAAADLRLARAVAAYAVVKAAVCVVLVVRPKVARLASRVRRLGVDEPGVRPALRRRFGFVL